MAKRKANIKHKPKGESGWREFFHFIALPPVRRLILIVIIIGLLFWQWPNINLLANETFALFGWGFVFLIAALVTLIVVVWRRKVLATIYHWNQWLGGIAFAFVAWGIMAFFQLGGSFGRVSLVVPIFLVPSAFSGWRLSASFSLPPGFACVLRLNSLPGQGNSSESVLPPDRLPILSLLRKSYPL